MSGDPVRPSRAGGLQPALALLLMVLPLLLSAWAVPRPPRRVASGGLADAAPPQAGATEGHAPPSRLRARGVPTASALLCVLLPFLVFVWAVPWLSLRVTPDDLPGARPSLACAPGGVGPYASPLYGSAASVSSDRRFPERLAEFSEELSGRIEFTSVTAVLLSVSLAASIVSVWVIAANAGAGYLAVSLVASAALGYFAARDSVGVDVYVTLKDALEALVLAAEGTRTPCGILARLHGVRGFTAGAAFLSSLLTFFAFGSVVSGCVGRLRERIPFEAADLRLKRLHLRYLIVSCSLVLTFGVLASRTYEVWGLSVVFPAQEEAGDAAAAVPEATVAAGAGAVAPLVAAGPALRAAPGAPSRPKQMMDRVAAAFQNSQAYLGILYSIAILCSMLPALVAWMAAARISVDARNEVGDEAAKAKWAKDNGISIDFKDAARTAVAVLGPVLANPVASILLKLVPSQG